MHLEIRGLEKLSFRERQVIMLKESGQTVEQISKRLGMSSSSVATLIARAKTKGYEIVCIIPGQELSLGGDEWSDEDLK
ncbi:MAG: sigma factor-like helix-turn-helix DNA-binding protein [Desulfitobacteriaceae bacterium]